MRSVDLERQKKVCVCVPAVDRRRLRRHPAEWATLFFLRYRMFAETFPLWHIIIICIMVRQMLAVAARRSRFTHARVPIHYNMVRTRSRKSCVRGKTREKTGTELYVRACDGCSPTSMSYQTPSAALPFAKYHFGDRVVSSCPLLLFTSTRAYIASTHIFDSRIV